MTSSLAPPRPSAVAAETAPAAPARTPPPRQLAALPAPRLDRRARCGLVALVVVLDAVLVGPLLHGGVLQLLDYGAYPVGPHPPAALSSYGFAPGITSRAPVYAALAWLFHAVHWAPLTLLPFVILAPLACVGFARLLPGRAVAIGTATILFTVNPFVDERMANGQVYVVMGYALLPLVLALAVRPLASLLATGALGGLLLTLAIALSVHFLFIAGAMLVAVVAVHAALRQPRVVAAAGAIAACGAVLNLYWLVPAWRAGAGSEAHVTGLDLGAFHTVGDPTWGLLTNVLGLYGFFRSGTPLVKDSFSGWPFVLLAILVVAVWGGFRLATREGAAGRGLALSCLVLAVAGVLLALGAQGPTGPVFTWLFVHVPGFTVLREPEKFSALLALAYATTFGVGVETVLRSVTRPRARAAGICALAAIPLLYGATELWGFSSASARGAVPASWAAADRAMAPGATALALPWSAYVQVPWLANRLVANPVVGAFDRPLVADDQAVGATDVQTTDPRTAFLQFALTEGPRLTEFGRVLAPLGVRDVVLAKVAGWQSFRWLDRQRDLHRLLDTTTLVVYRNDEPVPRAYEPRRALTVADWGAVLALAQRVPLTEYLVTVLHARPGPLRAPVLSTVPLAPIDVAAPGGSPVAQPLVVRATTTHIVLTNPAADGWGLPGFTATTQFGVTTAFTSVRAPRAGPATAGFGPWGLVREWYVLGALLVLADLVLLALALHRARTRAEPPPH